MQWGDGPLEAAARYRAGDGGETVSQGTQACDVDVVGADNLVRVVRKARRRLEPAAVTATPGFAFVWPDAAGAQKVAGTGSRNLPEDKHRRMVKIDASERKREKLADREAARSELTEEGCLRRQADRVGRLICGTHMEVMATQREKMVQAVRMVHAARAVAVLRQLWSNFRWCSGVKGWEARQAARELLRLAKEQKQGMVKELARVAEERVSRRAALGVKLRRKCAAVAAILAVRVKLMRRRWWRLREQEIKARLIQWRTRVEASSELLRAAQELQAKVSDWKSKIIEKREKFKERMRDRRQGCRVVETAPSALCDVLLHVRLRRLEGMQEVRLRRLRRSSTEV